ncbi:MATE family efflux transporter [Psychrosphaera ytuae]|nr:MATE family efflux transporter [Psychrosphaera ytuae]
MNPLIPCRIRIGSKIDNTIWHLAWPMILANISVPLLGFVDTAVIGHLSDSHFLAGTALASLFLSVVFWLMGFLRMSTTGLVAKARGQNDRQRVMLHLWQALLLSGVLGALILILQVPLFSLLTALSADDLAMASTYEAAKSYFDVRVWVAPIALANMVLSGFLIGSGQTRWVLRAVITCNLVNLLLDLLFVPVLGMGVQGVALASIIAEVVQCTMIIWLIRPEIKAVTVKLRDVFSGWATLLKMNGNLFIRSALLQLCLSFMTIYATQFGSSAVALNAIIMQFFLFLSFALDGIAFALESLVGNTLGKQKARRLGMFIKRGVTIGGVFAVGYFLLYLLCSQWVVMLLTDIPELRTQMDPYYKWIYLLPLCSFLSFLLDGVFVGLGWDKAMCNSMAIAAGVFFLVISISSALGNHGLWLGFCLFMLMRGLGQLMILYRQRNQLL